MAIAILTLIFIIVVFCAVALGKQVRKNDLRSVAGFLTALTLIARFIGYSALSLPIYYIASLTLDKEPGRGLTLSIPARLKLDPAFVSIDGTKETEITRIIGTLQISNPDLITVALSSVLVVILVILFHFTLKNTQLVLKSVHDRNPFVEENALRLRRVALFALCIWGVAGIYRTYMSFYLQQHLQVDGLNIVAGININFGPLFICGLIFVLSEVFRVGFELKKENELTV